MGGGSEGVGGEGGRIGRIGAVCGSGGCVSTEPPEAVEEWSETWRTIGEGKR